VIVINVDKVAVSGTKETDKYYYRHSGYPGGLRADSVGELRETRPDRLVWAAVKGMLPKNRLGRQVIRKLKVYRGPDHPHRSQNPELLEFSYRKVET
jgi:large subunit ribosomal protein L13